MQSREPAPSQTSLYRPALTGAEWHVLTTVLRVVRDSGVRRGWIEDIAQDFELLLPRRASGKSTIPTHQDLLRLADWRQKLSERGYRIPAFLTDSTVVGSVSVRLSPPELQALTGACSEIRQGRWGQPHLTAQVTDLTAMLESRPRSSTRSAIKYGTHPLRVPAVQLQARLAGGVRPLRQSLAKAAEAARKRALG